MKPKIELAVRYARGAQLVTVMVSIYGVPKTSSSIMPQACDSDIQPDSARSSKATSRRPAYSTMTVSVSLGALALLVALASQQGILATTGRARWQNVPAQAQVIDQRSFNALDTVLPPSQVNGSSVS